MPAALLLLLTVRLGAALSTRADNLIVLLAAGSCPNFTLAEADLVSADLSFANLNAADLRRANLSRARLDGADLRNADLRFSNLKGASLRGSDLRGAWLDGTDLRQEDLSGALINPGALDRSHWLGAMGINQGLRSTASLHNAGVDEANAGRRWPQAERLFGEAIQADPEQAMSWVSRGLSRGQQGDEAKAAQDLLHAADLLDRQGAPKQSVHIRQTVAKLQADEGDNSKSGNGLGSTLLRGRISTMSALAPLALKALVLGGM